MKCEGLGRSLRVDPDLMLDKTKSLEEGAILVPGYPVGSPGWQFYARYGRRGLVRAPDIRQCLAILVGTSHG